MKSRESPIDKSSEDPNRRPNIIILKFKPNESYPNNYYYYTEEKKEVKRIE